MGPPIPRRNQLVDPVPSFPIELVPKDIVPPEIHQSKTDGGIKACDQPIVLASRRELLTLAVTENCDHAFLPPTVREIRTERSGDEGGEDRRQDMQRLSDALVVRHHRLVPFRQMVTERVGPSPPSGTHRFEYTVVENEEDNDGLEVTANTLATPTGSAIITTSDGGTVLLRHESVFDSRRWVDGMRPAASSTRSEGPSIDVIWSEPLDADTVPSGAGGFSVNVPSNPNAMVTGLAISGSTVTLSLNTHIRYGTTGITVNYQPTATPLEDTAGILGRYPSRAAGSPPAPGTCQRH